MYKLIIIFLCFFPVFGMGQTDTLYYFGVNGKMKNVAEPAIKKEIDYKPGNRIKVITLKKQGEKWMSLYTEKISMTDDMNMKIRMKGDEFSGKVVRRFEKLDNGTYKFTDWLDERIKRTGFTLTKVPLILAGEVTEFYDNGRIKSVSQYTNNELISNQNWLPDGQKTVDDIFYSVDREPLFNQGLGNLHSQILKKIKDSNFDLASVEGKIVIGFIVRKNGTIGGIHVVKSLAPSLDAVVIQAFGSVVGDWTPASLGDENVNYLQLFPINFIYNKRDFDYLEIRGSMMYWQLN